MRRSIDTSPWKEPQGARDVVRPSLAQARELGLVAHQAGWFGRTTNLLEREPGNESLVIALVVRALVHTRSTFDREDELGDGLVSRLVAAASGVPSRRLQSSTWQAVVAVHDRAPRTCSACTFAPGKGSCAACGGSGRISAREHDDNETYACPSCNGKGLVACSRCDGGMRTQRVTVRTWNDHVAELEHAFFGPMSPLLMGAIPDHLLAEAQLPGELRVDLERPRPRALGSYRTGSRAGPPRFHGIEAGAVLTEVRETLTRLAAGGTLIERVVQAHAVPMSLLTYGETDVGIVALGSDRVKVFVASPE